jgi:hypothetical protein
MYQDVIAKHLSERLYVVAPLKKAQKSTEEREYYLNSGLFTKHLRMTTARILYDCQLPKNVPF